MNRILLFTSATCIPCKIAKPIVYKEFPKYSGDFSLNLVDAIDNPDKADQYQVMSVPTMIVEVDGKEVGRLQNITEKTLTAFMEGIYARLQDSEGNP